MSASEFFTIYSAIGAPFGVYFFLSRREKLSPLVFLKTIAAGLFWIFYAPRLFYSLFKSSKNTLLNSAADVSREKTIEALARKLEKIYAEFALNEQSPGFFAFRETLERYVGLTLALQTSAVDDAPPAEPEIFLAGGGSGRDLQIAARCFERRNLLRLRQHQIRAEHDFLQICRSVGENFFENADVESDAPRDFLKTALQLAELLYGVEATAGLRRTREIYERERQRRIAASVQETDRQERDLWKTWQPEHTLSSSLRSTLPTSPRPD